MKISCNILKKHIKNSDTIDWQNIWQLFTIRTAEVEGIELKGQDLRNVVVAQIVECQAHPKKEKYHILKVNNGTSIVDILCGAPNVRVGLRVPLVNVGGMVSGFEITEKTIAGVNSQGMLCSESELGISDNHEGIMELPDDYQIGKDLKEYIPEIEDIIVEIDNKSLTNRPDLWGHYGIAREIAAITNHELIAIDEYQTNDKKPNLSIKIESDLCLRYIGTKITNIKQKKTPYDIKIALYYTGMRSISLIVDLTNYLMLVLGQPMHAFDAGLVKEIEIACAQDNDQFTTLDGINRKLNKDCLMIKKKDKYFAIAGVMGGLEGGINSETNTIILESATFDATSIRKTATYLGLRTEASARYEKSLDPNLAMTAARYFIWLLHSIDSKIVLESNITDVYPQPFKEKKIVLSKAMINKYMGRDIEEQAVKDILEALAFKVTIAKDSYQVIVPTFRATKDVTIEVDLIEEIARMIGYENINLEPLKLDLTFNQHETLFELEYDAKRLLATKYSAHEVHSYLWYKTAFLNQLGLKKKNVQLLNKSEDNILRENMDLSLLELAQNNLKYVPKCQIFEIGTIIKESINQRQLGILISDDEKNLEKQYYEIKTMVSNLFLVLKNQEVVFVKNTNAQEIYDHNYGYFIYCCNRLIGEINIVKYEIAKKIAKKKSFVMATIDFDTFYEIKKIYNIYQQVSKYPQVSLDYTIITGKENKYRDIALIIDGFKSPIIKSVEFIDLYTDNYENKYTIRYTVGSEDKTLEQDELNDFKAQFINHVKTQGFDISE